MLTASERLEKKETISERMKGIYSLIEATANRVDETTGKPVRECFIMAF